MCGQDTILNSLFQLWMLGALDNLGAWALLETSQVARAGFIAIPDPTPTEDITSLGNKMAQFPLAGDSDV